MTSDSNCLQTIHRNSFVSVTHCHRGLPTILMCFHLLFAITKKVGNPARPDFNLTLVVHACTDFVCRLSQFRVCSLQSLHLKASYVIELGKGLSQLTKIPFQKKRHMHCVQSPPPPEDTGLIIGSRAKLHLAAAKLLTRAQRAVKQLGQNMRSVSGCVCACVRTI